RLGSDKQQANEILGSEGQLLAAQVRQAGGRILPQCGLSSGNSRPGVCLGSISARGGGLGDRAYRAGRISGWRSNAIQQSRARALLDGDAEEIRRQWQCRWIFTIRFRLDGKRERAVSLLHRHRALADPYERTNLSGQ